VITIFILIGLVAFVAIRWASALERTLPGMPVIGADVRVPTAICKPTAYRRNRFDPLNVSRKENP
jgi:hypothetical protein